MPFAMTEAQTALHLTVNDIALDRSPLWYEDETLVAGALLAFREDRAWIGGFGVVPERRGAGIGGRLMQTALAVCRTSGARRVQLEVLVQNAAAIALYDRVGFRARRRLLSHCFETTAPAAIGDAARVEPDFSIVASGAPSWQCEERSLRRQPELRAVAIEGSTLLFRSGNAVAQILAAQLASARHLRPLTAALAGWGASRILAFNQPHGGPAARALEGEGWPLAFAQHEMHLAL